MENNNNSSLPETATKNNKKWIAIVVLAVIGVALLAWCIYNAVTAGSIDKIYKFVC